MGEQVQRYEMSNTLDYGAQLVEVDGGDLVLSVDHERVVAALQSEAAALRREVEALREKVEHLRKNRDEWRDALIQAVEMVKQAAREPGRSGA